MSRAIASSILRKFSACCSSRESNVSLPSLVTPSTRNAISLPNCSPSCSTVARRVLDQSCSRAAQTLARVEVHVCAMMSATLTGWMKYGSPRAGAADPRCMRARVDVGLVDQLRVAVLVVRP